MRDGAIEREGGMIALTRELIPERASTIVDTRPLRRANEETFVRDPHQGSLSLKNISAFELARLSR